MWRKVTTAVVSVLVIIFLPITLFGLVLPFNDYRADGMSVPVECDGPTAVLLLIVPSLVVYAAGLAYFALALRGERRTVLTNVLAVFCVVMLFAVGGKAWGAYREQRTAEYRRTCLEE